MGSKIKYLILCVLSKTNFVISHVLLNVIRIQLNPLMDVIGLLVQILIKNCLN